MSTNEEPIVDSVLKRPVRRDSVFQPISMVL